MTTHCTGPRLSAWLAPGAGAVAGPGAGAGAGAGGEATLGGGSTVATTVTSTGTVLLYCSTLSEDIFMENAGSSTWKATAFFSGCSSAVSTVGVGLVILISKPGASSSTLATVLPELGGGGRPGGAVVVEEGIEVSVGGVAYSEGGVGGTTATGWGGAGAAAAGGAGGNGGRPGGAPKLGMSSSVSEHSVIDTSGDQSSPLA